MFIALTALAIPVHSSAQVATTPVEPFYVGTFAIDGNPTVALVLREQLIVDIAAANRELELEPEYVHIDPPADMLELIGQYEYGHQRGGTLRAGPAPLHLDPDQKACDQCACMIRPMNTLVSSANT